MKNKYDLFKQNYQFYILLFRCGNFFISLNDDAIVINNVFDYKLVDTGKFIKVGFPISSINKIENELNDKKINYLIIHDEIIQKGKFKPNNYQNYLTQNNYETTIKRINIINRLLKNNISNKNIGIILDNIENIIWKINY